MVSLFSSNRFWIAVLTLIVIVIGVFHPAFSLPVEQMGAMIALLAALIFAQAMSPGSPAAKLSGLFTDKSFWGAVIGLFIIIMQIFVPSFSLDAVKLGGLCIVLCPYIIGVVFDPGDPQAKISGLLRSWKFWETCVGILVVVLAGFGLVLPFGLTDVQLIEICATFGLMITGHAIEGNVSKRRALSAMKTAK